MKSFAWTIVTRPPGTGLRTFPGARHCLPLHRDTLDQEGGVLPYEAQTGAVTLIQRFGSALNLNVHFHMLFLDGVYVEHPDGSLRFRWVKAPSSAEPDRLTQTMAQRIGRHLERQELNLDEIIATSPACAETMREALPSVPVHLAPHHADPAITPGYNATGHVVYTGAVRYISAEKRAIRASCRMLGRKLVIEAAKHTPTKLQGAGLMLHIRLKPQDTHLNRYCKPQIKLENAAAAGLPVVASDHPCATSLRPEVVRHAGNWDESIRNGLAAEPLRNPVTLKEHVERLRKILDL